MNMSGSGHLRPISGNTINNSNARNDDGTEKTARHHLLVQRKSMGSPLTLPASPTTAKRLSLRETYEGVIPRNALNTSSVLDGNGSNGNGPRRITDVTTLREIYQSSIELYKAHKITQQNAFSIKLIECLQEIIKLDTFDKNNMHEFGRTLEIGGKIYVCRVELTHNQVMNLASEIGVGMKAAKKARMNPDEEEEDGNGCGVDDGGMGEEDDNEKKKTQKKKRTKMKHRHLKSEESLEMEFNLARRVQDRRETFEELFDNWIDNDEDFDYDSVLYRHRKKKEEELKMCDEALAAKENLNFSLHVVNPDLLSIIIFFPFYFHQSGVWNKKAFDLWGRLLPGYDHAQFNLAHRPGSQNHNYEYLSQNRPGSLMPPDAAGNDDDMDVGGNSFNDDNAGGFPGGGSILDECGQVKPVDINNLKSLDELGKYYLALKKLHLHKQDIYGWAGPNFTRNRRPLPNNTDAGKSKRPRLKKDPEIIDFLTVDWKNKNNRYQLVPPERTQLDKAVIDEWVYSKTSIPYMGLLEPDFDDDEAEFDEPFDMADEKSENFVDPLLRYFVDPNRNLLQLFSSGRHQAEMSAADDHDWSCNEDVPELPDIEGVREFEDDQCADVNKENAATGSRSMHLYSDALKSFAHCFPNPIPGMPNPFEDPLSDAFNVDALRFAKQPKPINIHLLKSVILQILMRKLDLDLVEGKPNLNEETSLDILEFMQLLFEEIDNRTRHFLSISIVTVALLHIVVEHKLFMESDLTAGSNGKIICRGKLWSHKDHIPT